MRRILLLSVVVSLAVLPTAASATFSVIQDSCRTEGNTEITYFSFVNFNSPVPVCDMHFIPENPVPGCTIIGCAAPAGWACALNPGNLGVDYTALSPADCVTAGNILSGFSYTLDPEFCCYIVQFTDENHEVIAEQEECFNCIHVGVDSESWGNVKQMFR